MNRKKVGIILGYGHMGRLHKARLADLGVETLAFDGKADCHRALDGRLLDAHPDADFFTVISTPASSHLEYAELSLKAGLDTFVEKPLATSALCARKLLQLADEKKRLLFTGHSENFNPAFLRFKTDLSNALRAGNLQALSFVRHNAASGRGLDVSTVWDIGVHDFALFFELMQAFPECPWKEIPVRFSESRKSLAVERSIRAECHSSDGKTFFVSADLNGRNQPGIAESDPVASELREFLRLKDLPENERLEQAKENAETALFAVRAAEVYPEIPKNPK